MSAMQKQLLLRSGFLGWLCLVGFFVAWRFSFCPAFDQSKYKWLSIGMTESEVVAILGKPAGGYSTGPLMARPTYDESDKMKLQKFYQAYVLRAKGSTDCIKQWVDDWDSIWVTFDGEGKLVGTHHLEVRRVGPASLIELLRCYLRI